MCLRLWYKALKIPIDMSLTFEKKILSVCDRGKESSSSLSHTLVKTLFTYSYSYSYSSTPPVKLVVMSMSLKIHVLTSLTFEKTSVRSCLTLEEILFIRHRLWYKTNSNRRVSDF